MILFIFVGVYENDDPIELDDMYLHMTEDGNIRQHVSTRNLITHSNIGTLRK